MTNGDMLNLLFAFENKLNGFILSLLQGWVLPKIPPWARTVAIIAAVLFLSVVLPLMASWNQLLLLLALIPVAGAGLALIQLPPLGLIGLIITALIVPSPSLPGGFNFAVLLLIALIGLWLLEMIVVQRKLELLPSRTVWPLLALIFVATLSFGVGQIPWFTFARAAPLDAQIGGLFIFILAPGAFLLTAHLIRELRWLEWLTWVFLALGGLFVAGWVTPGLGSITGRLFQLGATSNSMFWTWLVALAFSQALFNGKLHPGWRAALGGLVVLTLYVAYVLNNGWKSGYLPPMVSIAVIIGVRSWRLGLLMAVMGILPAMFLSSEAVATEDYSYGTRLDAWIIILEMVKTNPLLGFGPANYYWYTPLFPIRGWAVRFNSHNQYLDIIAQTGILGLACVVWFAWEVGWLGWQLKDRVPSGFAQAYVYGALGGLVGMLASGILVDWFLPFVYNIGLSGFRGSMLAWIFLGGLMSLEQMYRREA